MKRFLSGSVLVLGLMGGMIMTCSATEMVTLSGRIHDKAGKALAGISLALTGIVQEAELERSLVTDAEGRFSIEVPPGRWTGIPDEIELLKRGYFCVPGFVWEPEIVVDDMGIAPGEIILFESPVDMELVAVPITPEIKVTDRDAEKGTVKLTAEFQFGEFEPPYFQVAYELMRSEDMKSWEPVTILYLESFGGAKFVDATPGNGQCYYRARRQGPVTVLQSF